MTYSALKRKLRSVGDNESGLAMVELAVSLPFFLGLGIGGLELANYTSVVMQLNKITIHTADNAARIGTSTPDGVRTISEAQIKDVFAGAMRAGRSIGLEGQHSYANPSTGNATNRGNARIILSSVEQVNPADPSDRQYVSGGNAVPGPPTFSVQTMVQRHRLQAPAALAPLVGKFYRPLEGRSCSSKHNIITNL